MSTPPAPDGPLQFDEAEYERGSAAPDGLACAVCSEAIRDRYHETGGNVVCEPCRERMEASFRGGSRFGRLAKATIFGSIAAALGAGLYYAIVKATDYNIGLVAIVIGLMVGGAVRAGSGGRGGRAYQFLALFLTYSALAGMLTPFLIGELQERQQQEERQQEEEIKAFLEKLQRENPEEEEADADEVADAPKADADEAADAPKADADEKADAPKAVEVADADAAAEADADHDADEAMDELVLEAAPTFGELAVALAVLIALCYALPVMVGIGSPISGLIFGFALWQAWKVNQKAVLAFNGPFHLAPPGMVALEPEAEADDAPREDDRHGA